MSQGARVAFPTLHGKGPAVAEALAAVGYVVEVTERVDTDAMGTFSGDIPRWGTQLEAAERKARAGLELLDTRFGVASEGAFGAGPFGMTAWNTEIVVLVDAGSGVSVVGRASGPISNHDHAVVTDEHELLRFAARAGFPSHGLVVHGPGSIAKGLVEEAALRAAFRAALRPDSGVLVQNDLRAHMHPVRMARIREAARDLANRLGRRCEVCGAPGFGREGVVTGPPCGMCGCPTHQARAERWSCPACSHAEERPMGVEVGDPFWCPRCNP